jgi:hypothetical protein
MQTLQEEEILRASRFGDDESVSKEIGNFVNVNVEDKVSVLTIPIFQTVKAEQTRLVNIGRVHATPSCCRERACVHSGYPRPRWGTQSHQKQGNFTSSCKIYI